MNITIIGRKCNPREDFRTRVEKRLLKVEKLFGEDAGLCQQYLFLPDVYETLPFPVGKVGHWWGNNPKKKCQEERLSEGQVSVEF